MRQVILNIPDGEFDFFMKLIQKFKYKTTEANGFGISDNVQQLVDERRKTANSLDYLTREQANDKIKNKYGF